ncbi:polysaccharide biosynthesis/export family protein [Labrys sp. LIt4]|uniref:polysaccharide biosynthesis/export family protein n=1 Tax=Labrys sp. LIt4 TaxID=2821355 RepID=UPI001AE011DC|nr:polysaccharide biosynthesis/export family protein [Labrys sp. LIt4]MBP0579041.1 polysaccharide biosynthesis/export family protein [Labrys sp. LIt4]
MSFEAFHRAAFSRKSRRSGLRRLAIAVLTTAVATVGIATTALAEPYLLGPEDKLKIRVYDWRASSSEVHEWAALTGEFVVGASGNVSLPLIGEVPAAGKSTGDLSVLIGEKLQASIGLSNRPDASVEVSTYRPFYILGMVTTPGQYPYKPGLTVLQAVSTAGGVLRVSDFGLLSFQRESLVNRGDLRTLAVERLGLLAREARLDAELQGSDTITFPKDLMSQADTPQVAQMMKEEQLLFEARKQALRSQEDAINQTKKLLGSEIESLKAKSQSLQRQLELAKEELDNVNGLVSKGLAVASRKLALDQNVSQFESNRLDIDLLILRAQQDISKAERDVVDLHNKRRNDILTEISDVRGKISVNAEKTTTTQGLVYNAEVQAPQAVVSQMGNLNSKLTFAIIRRVGDKTQTIEANEADPVYPGDVVRVERLGAAPNGQEIVPRSSASAQP